jgi:hypothetical protein
MRVIKVVFGAVLAVQLGCAAAGQAPSASSSGASGDPPDPKCARITSGATKAVNRDNDKPPRDKKEATKRLERAEKELGRLEEKLEKANLAATCTEPVALLKAHVESAKQALEAAPSTDERKQAEQDVKQAKIDAYHGKVEIASVSATPGGTPKTQFSCGEPIWAKMTIFAGSKAWGVGSTPLTVSIDGKVERGASVGVTKAIEPGATLEATWNLTPDKNAVSASELYKVPAYNSVATRLAALASGIHKVHLSGGSSSGAEFTVECADFSTSEYAKRAREFEELVRAAVHMSEERNPSISAKAKQLADKGECRDWNHGVCWEAGAVPLAVHTTSTAPETFRNDTAINGRGYSVEIALKHKDGSCSLRSASYWLRFVADEVRYEEAYTLVASGSPTKMACANVK